MCISGFGYASAPYHGRLTRTVMRRPQMLVAPDSAAEENFNRFVPRTPETRRASSPTLRRPPGPELHRSREPASTAWSQCHSHRHAAPPRPSVPRPVQQCAHLFPACRGRGSRGARAFRRYRGDPCRRLVNAVVGFLQEGKAEDALAAIRDMIAPRASVLRDGSASASLRPTSFRATSS
jgi:hypothetical protein